MQCDFCSSPDVRYAYPADDFIARTIEYNGMPIVAGSSGGWAACLPCHQLIGNNDREGLLKHSVDNFYVVYGTDIPREVITRTIREIQAGFFASRTGIAIPVSVVF